MGLRGPRPKPTEVKKREGNPGKRPLNKKEPKAPLVLPIPPAHFNVELRKIWNATAKVLYDAKLLTTLDTTSLEGFCINLYRARAADKELIDNDFTMQTMQGNTIQVPAVAISRTCWEMVRKYGAEFGMTPAARSRIEADVQSNNTEDDDKEADKEFFTPTG